MLIVRRIKVNDVRFFKFVRKNDGIFAKDGDRTLEIAENRRFQLDSAEYAGERVFADTTVTALALLVFVKAFENTAS